MKKAWIILIALVVLTAVAVLLLLPGKDKAQFEATVLEINGNSVLVELDEAYAMQYGSDKISFGTADLEKLDVQVGSRVKVAFNGEVMESYPAQIRAISWSKVTP